MNKLTKKEVQKIIKLLYSEQYTRAQIAKKVGVNVFIVTRIYTLTNWSRIRKEHPHAQSSASRRRI